MNSRLSFSNITIQMKPYIHFRWMSINSINDMKNAKSAPNLIKFYVINMFTVQLLQRWDAILVKSNSVFSLSASKNQKTKLNMDNFS